MKEKKTKTFENRKEIEDRHEDGEDSNDIGVIVKGKKSRELESEKGLVKKNIESEVIVSEVDGGGVIEKETGEVKELEEEVEVEERFGNDVDRNLRKLEALGWFGFSQVSKEIIRSLTEGSD